MPIMNQKLVKDFFEAVEVDRAITKQPVSYTHLTLPTSDLV